MIKAIFYTRFHPEKGPRVLHQVPEGSVVAQSTTSDANAPQQPLFDFISISDLLIPRQEFCDRLVTVATPHHRIIGYPVCIEDPRYDRNQFIFNLALVLERDADFSVYTNVVRKLAALFRNLEEQSRFLSKEEEGLRSWSQKSKTLPIEDWSLGPYAAYQELHDDVHFDSMANSIDLANTENSHSTKVYAICEQIMEDLNNYSECMIPIDETNTINLKLFQKKPPPAPVFAWHVPLATVQLTNMSISSDLTMQRIIEYIDGVSSVAQIAQLADTDLGLTRKAIAHLLYYKCVLLLDIFQFGAIYAPTADIGAFFEDEEAQNECLRYVSVGHYRRLDELDPEYAKNGEQWGFKSGEPGVDKMQLIQLYSSLCQGLTLRKWCSEHDTLIAGIDVRRFITFGIIKGFLYRVHKYAFVDANLLASEEVHQITPTQSLNMPLRDGRRGSVAPSVVERSLPLAKYLDGLHCFDEICTDLQLSEKSLMEKIKKSYPDVQIIHR